MANMSSANGSVTITAPTEEIATKLAKKLTEVTIQWEYYISIENNCVENVINNNDGTVSVTFPLVASGRNTFEEAAKEFPNWAMEEADFSEFKDTRLEMFIDYVDVEPGYEILYAADSNLVKEAGEDKFQCESFQMAEMEFNYENVASCFSEDFADDCFLE